MKNGQGSKRVLDLFDLRLLNDLHKNKVLGIIELSKKYKIAPANLKVHLDRLEKYGFLMICILPFKPKGYPCVVYKKIPITTFEGMYLSRLFDRG